MVMEFITGLRQKILEEKARLDAMRLAEDEYKQRFEEMIMKATTNIKCGNEVLLNILPSSGEVLQNMERNISALNNGRHR